MSRPAGRAAPGTENIVDQPVKRLVEGGETVVCPDGGVAVRRAGRVFRWCGARGVFRQEPARPRRRGRGEGLAAGVACSGVRA